MFIDFGTKFNNGVVDIIFAPALAYQRFELYRGLGEKGDIYRFPVAWITGAIVVNRDALLANFPDMDAQPLTMRDYALAQLEDVFDRLEQFEQEVDDNHWMASATPC